jgi:hypothetical protein
VQTSPPNSGYAFWSRVLARCNRLKPRLAPSLRPHDPQLILKRASASRSSGEWSKDDYDLLADGIVVGRIM